MRLREAAWALSGFCLGSAPADAQELVQFGIAGGRLSDALVALAEGARITIDASDPGLRRIGSRPVRGRMSIQSALDRLLEGSGYTYRFVTPRVVRVVPVAPAPPRPRPPAQPPPSLPLRAQAPSPEPPDIIVTASKQGTALDRYAGSVHLIDLTQEESGRQGARGSQWLVNRLPMLSSTNLGPGRNKLFVRGIADSSFNGPSQSIVGLYLGDVRLTFNAPDPDLRLYDVERIELLEGPQGTLYGTGSLGGVLRLVPNGPDTSRFAAAVSGGLQLIRYGGQGWDAAGTVNLPLVPGQLAIRAVGYAVREAGYIDDLRRDLRDVNRASVRGGRAVLAWDAGNEWRFEIGGVAQDIAVQDGQYAMRGLPSLSRRSRLAQPFDNDYRLAYVKVRKQWDGVELVSVTSMVNHALETQFDATGFPGMRGPRLYVEDIDITLISNETRVSEPDARGEGWVVGWSLVHDASRISRSLGRPPDPPSIAGVRNEINEAALFGQYSHSLTSGLVATLGGRLTYSKARGTLLNVPDQDEDEVEPGRTDVRLSPTTALTWSPAERLLLFARYQQGFRAGGLAVLGGGEPEVRRFESDSITSVEVGLRLGRDGVSAFTLQAALSYAAWDDVQADLIGPRGLPYTTNLGDGRIYGFEIEAVWRVTPALSVDAALFVNDSALSRPDPEFSAVDERSLPNVADAGVRAAAHFKTRLSKSLALSVDGSVRYVGESHLGVGAPIEGEQGGFVEADLGARLAWGTLGLSLDVTNIAEGRGNRFSFGNPFSLPSGGQVTPLRPRTIRIGLDMAF